jgi:hypothetical protein
MPGLPHICSPGVPPPPACKAAQAWHNEGMPELRQVP